MKRGICISIVGFFVFIALPSQIWAASISETSAAIGEGCTASGLNSTAMGKNTTASGDYSTAMGLRTMAIGYESVAMGYKTRAGGDQSFAGGRNMKLSVGSNHTFIWGDSGNEDEQIIYAHNTFLIFPIGTTGKVGIGTKSPKCLMDARNEKSTFNTSNINDLNLLVANNAASLSGGKAAIGFSVSNVIDSNNIFGAMITHTPEGSYSNGGLEFWTKDGNSSIMTLSEKMRIDRNGNVGIGTPSPSKRLYVNGSAGGTQAWNASDGREKTDIKPIGNALGNILEIRGISYRWKNGDERESQGFDNKAHFGVIAQEVEAVYPQLVDNPGITEKRKHVEYNGLVGILIEAVKELKEMNDVQQAEIDELRSVIKDLRNNHQQIAKR